MKHHVNEFVSHKGRTYRVALAPRHTPPKPLVIVRRSAIGDYAGYCIDARDYGRLAFGLADAPRANGVNGT